MDPIGNIKICDKIFHNMSYANRRRRTGEVSCRSPASRFLVQRSAASFRPFVFVELIYRFKVPASRSAPNVWKNRPRVRRPALPARQRIPRLSVAVGRHPLWLATPTSSIKIAGSGRLADNVFCPSLPQPSDLELHLRMTGHGVYHVIGIQLVLSYASRAYPFPPRRCYRRALLQSHRHALFWRDQSEGEMP